MRKRLGAWDATVLAVKSNASNSFIHQSAYLGFSVGRRPTGLDPQVYCLLSYPQGDWLLRSRPLFVGHITVS
jgi:hypothetical protein